MLYHGKTPHSFPFDPFKAYVVSRSIGWISTTEGSRERVEGWRKAKL